jgi:hypothetical protein
MSGDVASGKIHPHTNKMRRVIDIINRPFRGITLKSGQQAIERESRTKTDPETGKPLIRHEKRPASMQQLDQASTKRLSMNNKNGVSMMHMGDDHVHVAVHHRTGEVALIPTSNDHAHMGDKMGLSKTITYDHFAGDDHGHKNTLGLTLRGARAKGSTVNVSLETSSGHMVDAVRDAGGHVFDSLDHATEHLRSHGWGARSGHSMDVYPSSSTIGNPIAEGIFNPEKGYPEIYRIAAGKSKENKETDSILKNIGLAVTSMLARDEEEEEKEPEKTDEVEAPSEAEETSFLDNIRSWFGGAVDKRYDDSVKPVKEQTDDDDDDSDTKPGEDQEIPYQTPEPGTKVVGADSGGGSPYVKPVKSAMVGNDELEESIRKSFSDFLLKEKNIDTGVRGFMEPVTNKSKRDLDDTITMLIASVANKNKKDSCGCPHDK